ncbi:uncharacterized protein RSE6_08861 [Rhynchosporium secalis]|uniref:DUF6606 domain-containing protein n=1 Tax=Rhynchosporium secalis TaxID=38038 RepID=A0A1E1MHK1_RHYSE|nr:uncharacterized protein RSE6_08861 [Rhynchosporium secalis]
MYPSSYSLTQPLHLLPEKGRIAIHIGAQNAGLLISRVADQMNFKAFELFPDNESVIGTKGRAVSVPSSTFSDDAFQTTISQTLAKMSTEPVEEMHPQVTKSGQQLQEIRNTTRPDIVTEHLMSYFRACGEPVVVSTIWKKTREEVLWKDALLSWRRSPTWLLVHVSLQLTFSRLSADSSESLYKPFMAFLKSRVLDLFHGLSFESSLIYVMNAKTEQRILKLGDTDPQSWLAEVQEVLSRAAARIDSRWKSVISQNSRTPDFSTLQYIQPAQDVLHKFPDLYNLSTL